MRIGLISDTHLLAGDVLDDAVRRAFAGVDLILHAGDIYHSSVLDQLEALAPVLAAEGNGDEERGLKDPRVKPVHVIEIEGVRLGLVHGMVYPEAGHWILAREMERCFGGPVAVAVFGDTHVALVEECRGVLVVNPGSATWPNNWGRQPGTVALLEIDGFGVRARLVELG